MTTPQDPPVCTICLEELLHCEYDLCVLTACGHVFHHMCIEKYLDVMKKPLTSDERARGMKGGIETRCPLCRVVYNKRGLKKLMNLDANLVSAALKSISAPTAIGANFNSSVENGDIHALYNAEKAASDSLAREKFDLLNTVKKLEERVEEAVSQSQQLRLENNILSSRVNSLNADITALNEALKDKTQSLEIMSEKVKESIKARNQTGIYEAAVEFLNSSDIVTFKKRMVEVFRSTSRQGPSESSEMWSTIAAIIEKKSITTQNELNSVSLELESLRTASRVVQDDYDKLKVERDALLRSNKSLRSENEGLKKNMVNYKDNLASWKAKMKDLNSTHSNQSSSSKPSTTNHVYDGSKGKVNTSGILKSSFFSNSYTPTSSTSSPFPSSHNSPLGSQLKPEESTSQHSKKSLPSSRDSPLTSSTSADKPGLKRSSPTADQNSESNSSYPKGSSYESITRTSPNTSSSKSTGINSLSERERLFAMFTKKTASAVISPSNSSSSSHSSRSTNGRKVPFSSQSDIIVIDDDDDDGDGTVGITSVSNNVIADTPSPSIMTYNSGSSDSPSNLESGAPAELGVITSSTFVHGGCSNSQQPTSSSSPKKMRLS